MRARWSSPSLILAGSLLAGVAVATLHADDPRPAAEARRWRQHDIERPHPPVVEPRDNPALPPKDAVVLFDGSNLDAWQAPGGRPARWRVVDGAMETVPGAGMIETKGKFGDVQVHVEWAAPQTPNGKGQDRGNSGLFLLGQYEVQILDSYQADTYADGQAGAIYGQYPPLANAARPPGQWQTYDIAFRRPRFDGSGHLLEPARLTVFHNGVLIQNNEEPFGPSSWLKWLPYSNGPAKGPIALQDHDHPVRFRNLWVRELPERPAPPAGRATADLPPLAALSPADLDRLVGTYRMGDKPGAATAKIVRDGDHLTMTLSFRPQALALLPLSATEFAMPYTDGHFTFRVDEAGKAKSALFRIGDGSRELTRVGP